MVRAARASGAARLAPAISRTRPLATQATIFPALDLADTHESAQGGSGGGAIGATDGAEHRGAVQPLQVRPAVRAAAAEMHARLPIARVRIRAQDSGGDRESEAAMCTDASPAAAQASPASGGGMDLESDDGASAPGPAAAGLAPPPFSQAGRPAPGVFEAGPSKPPAARRWAPGGGAMAAGPADPKGTVATTAFVFVFMT